MSKKENNATVILLVHSKIAMFEWGKVLTDLLSARATKEKRDLQIVYDVKDIKQFDLPVIVIGVDREWIMTVLEYLGAARSRVILLTGVAPKDYEFVSHISADQQLSVKKSIDLLQANGRTRTAFFGVQKNDTSDQIKARIFSEKFSSDDVYQIKSSVVDCCDRLLSNLHRYDSVICANDILAVYLLSRCRSLNIEIPQRLQVIGNGNLWIGSHVTPPITTVSYNSEATVRIAFQTYKNLCEFEGIAPINVSFCGNIVQRESTGAVSSADDSTVQKRGSYFDFERETVCRELSQIAMLDRVFSTCTKEKTDILKLFASGASVAQIAEEVFLSQDTVAYHIKKLYKQLGIHSKKELMDIIRLYGIKF